MSLKQILVWAVRVGVGLLLFTPLILPTSLFFPFITGKGFFFRIVTEIIFGAWVALAFLYREYQPKKSLLLLVLATFMVSLVISGITGVDPYHSFWSNFERMEGLVTHLHLFALCIAVAHTFRSKKEWFVLLLISLGVSVLVSFYGLCERIFYNDGINPVTTLERWCTTQSGGERIYATFGNFIYLAVYALFHMFFAALAAASLKDRVVRAALASVFLLNAIVFYLAGSRGPVVGLFVALLVMIVLALLASPKKRYRTYLIGCLVVVALTPMVFESIDHTQFVQKSPLLARLSSLSFENIQEQPRVKIWRIGLASVVERPLFGWGVENFSIPYAKYYDPTLFGNEPWFDRAHNMFLEWLVSGGVVTFVLYLFLLGFVFATLYRLVRGNQLTSYEGILLVGMIVAYVVQNFFVFDTITNYIFFFLLLAFLHSELIGKKHAQGASRGVMHSIGAAGMVLLTLIAGIWLNVKPIFAARYLSDALAGISKAKSVDDITLAFQKVENLNTFGSSEARERLADLVIQAAIGGGKPKMLMPLVDDAIGRLENAQTTRSNAKTLIMLGKLYTIKAHWTGKNGDKAEMYYQKAQELAPRYPTIQLGLAELYIGMGEKKKALIVANKAFDLVGANSQMFEAVLSMHILAGEFEKAGELFDSYINSGKIVLYNPGSSEAETQILLQRFLRTSGDLNQRLVLLKIFEKKIEHPLLSVAFAQTYAELGDRIQARLYAEDALKRDPSLKDEIEKFIASLEPLR